MANTLPSIVGVLGGGRMRAGVADAFLTSGAQSLVVEQRVEPATPGHERVLLDVAGSVERGRVSGTAAEYEAQLTVTTDQAAFAKARLVIEAVPEDFDLKVSAL